ncbi:hypothetical protein JCM10450v2_007135 [Rhodotorula kratochvilovae]
MLRTLLYAFSRPLKPSLGRNFHTALPSLRHVTLVPSPETKDLRPVSFRLDEAMYEQLSAGPKLAIARALNRLARDASMGSDEPVVPAGHLLRLREVRKQGQDELEAHVHLACVDPRLLDPVQRGELREDRLEQWLDATKLCDIIYSLLWLRAAKQGVIKTVAPVKGVPSEFDFLQDEAIRPKVFRCTDGPDGTRPYELLDLLWQYETDHFDSADERKHTALDSTERTNEIVRFLNQPSVRRLRGLDEAVWAPFDFGEDDEGEHPCTMTRT